MRVELSGMGLMPLEKRLQSVPLDTDNWPRAIKMYYDCPLPPSKKRTVSEKNNGGPHLWGGVSNPTFLWEMHTPDTKLSK